MTTALMIVFGEFAYDGRARRMHEIAAHDHTVSVLDWSWFMSAVGPGSKLASPGAGAAPRHLAFWRAVARQARLVRPDIVLAQNFFTAFPGWLAARATGARLIYDAYELIIPERGASISARDRLWFELERFVAPRADLIVAANPERAALMGAHYPLSSPPAVMRNVDLAPAVTDRDRALVRASYPALQRRGASDKILLYQGHVARDRNIDRFVALLDLLPPNYRLVVAGDGPDRAALQTMAAPHLASGRFSALGRVPHDDLPAITSLADIGIVSYPWTGRNNQLCASGKFFDYAQAGLPIIASNQAPLEKLCADYGVAQLFGPTTTQATLAAAVTELAARRNEATQRSKPFMQAHDPAAERRRVRDRMGLR